MGGYTGNDVARRWRAARGDDHLTDILVKSLVGARDCSGQSDICSMAMSLVIHD